MPAGRGAWQDFLYVLSEQKESPTLLIDDVTELARCLKLAECSREPMAPLPCPVLYLYDHAGNLHGRLLPDMLDADTGTVTARVRATLPDRSFAYAAIVADSWAVVGRGDPIDGPEVTTTGELAADYASNPASPVVPALVVFAVNAHGHREARVTTFRWDDQGLPAWEHEFDVGTVSFTGPLSEMACAIVGVH